MKDSACPHTLTEREHQAYSALTSRSMDSGVDLSTSSSQEVEGTQGKDAKEMHSVGFVSLSGVRNRRDADLDARLASSEW
eukprot:303524-Rhodomonas_salina.1